MWFRLKPRLRCCGSSCARENNCLALSPPQTRARSAASAARAARAATAAATAALAALGAIGGEATFRAMSCRSPTPPCSTTATALIPPSASALRPPLLKRTPRRQPKIAVAGTLAANDPTMAARLQAAQQRIADTQQNLDFLGQHLTDRGFFSEPLDRKYVGEVLSLFTPSSSAPMRPLLDKAFSQMLPKLDGEALAVLLTGMAYARLPHEPAWRAAGDASMALAAVGDFSGAQLTDVAWAFATAGEQRPELFSALRQAMASRKGELSDTESRTFAWACAQVGEHCIELFGAPSVDAPAETAHALWTRMQSLLKDVPRTAGEQVTAEPVPVVTVRGVVSAEQGAELLRMADAAELWLPSSRRGARSADGVDARRTSWSAVLSPPQLRRHPTVVGIRRWAAETFAVPQSYVEELQLVRYFRGQEYGSHVDWGQAQDPSLWIAGQRIATALIYLSTLPDGCGGETVFPHLDAMVKPEAGTALLWPNVNKDGSPEPLVEHSAAPVLCDVPKYAVNVWIRGQPLPALAAKA